MAEINKIFAPITPAAEKPSSTARQSRVPTILLSNIIFPPNKISYSDSRNSKEATTIEI
jgi:hypothetical protein